MKLVAIVFETSYGNTHAVAEAIADGLRPGHRVVVMPVGHVDPAVIAVADLVVVGGPTHVHGMSSMRTRAAAAEAVATSEGPLRLDIDAGTDAGGDGVREWLDTVVATGTHAAAFDTRMDISSVLSGRASRQIDRRLRRCGFRTVAAPRSFLVSRATALVPGQVAAARQWGHELSDLIDARPVAMLP